jgi:anti-sigma factor RsiW
MPDTPHDEAEELLPWYATGQLDAADRALVENHLAACARCQRQLHAERVLIEEFRTLTPEIDSGWARLRARIDAERPKRQPIGRLAGEFWQAFTRPVIATLAAAQVAFVAFAAMFLQWFSQPAYVALGSAPAAASANVIVMFRPEAREAQLRAALEATGASLVGGPTDADAYLLHVPAKARPSALQKLQHDSNVTLAQPIDEPPQ